VRISINKKIGLGFAMQVALVLAGSVFNLSQFQRLEKLVGRANAMREPLVQSSVRMAEGYTLLTVIVSIAFGLFIAWVVSSRITEYKDVGFAEGVIRVREKKEWNFKPKSEEIRDVPLTDGLLDLLGERSKTATNRLIFCLPSPFEVTEYAPGRHPERQVPDHMQDHCPQSRAKLWGLRERAGPTLCGGSVLWGLDTA
jgi:hypothetical protein